MLATLIEKEIRDLLGSTKFAISFSVCAVLLVLSFVSGAQNYKAAQRQYEAAKAENLRQLDGLTDWLMLRQNRIFLPPEPVAAIVTGISNDVGRTVEVTGRGELTTQDSRFEGEPLFAVFRFLDLEFVFGVVLSLLAILLGYDAGRIDCGARTGVDHSGVGGVFTSHRNGNSDGRRQLATAGISDRNRAFVFRRYADAFDHGVVDDPPLIQLVSHHVGYLGDGGFCGPAGGGIIGR